MMINQYDCVEYPRVMTPEEQRRQEELKEARERDNEEKAVTLFVKYFKTLTSEGIADGDAANVAYTVLFGRRQPY